MDAEACGAAAARGGPVALRRVVFAGACRLADRLSSPRYHVTARTADGVVEVEVEAGFARLLSLASEQPFGAALEALEEAVGAEGAERLRAALPGWLQLARERGWWVGFSAQ